MLHWKPTAPFLGSSPCSHFLCFFFFFVPQPRTPAYRSSLVLVFLSRFVLRRFYGGDGGCAVLPVRSREGREKASRGGRGDAGGPGVRCEAGVPRRVGKSDHQERGLPKPVLPGETASARCWCALLVRAVSDRVSFRGVAVAAVFFCNERTVTFWKC